MSRLAAFVARYLRNVYLNVVVCSTLVPDPLRWRLYRWAGLDVGRANIFARAWIAPDGRAISIGEGSFVNSGLTVLGARSVSIGARCAIGPGVVLAGSSHEIGDAHARAGALTRGTIEIGDGCWLGARVVMLPDSSVGAGSIVAAGSVVRGTLPPNGLYAGAPAVRIRDLDP